MNASWIQVATTPPIWRTTVNAHISSSSPDMDISVRVEPAAASMISGATVSARVGIIGVVVDAAGAEPAALAVICGTAIGARVGRLRSERAHRVPPRDSRRLVRSACISVGSVDCAVLVFLRAAGGCLHDHSVAGNLGSHGI